MPAKLKLSEAAVKTIRRRLHAGARRKELADAYGVNRKTIQRRVNALELAERGRQSDVEGKSAPAPEPAPTSSLAGPSSSQQERADAGRPGSARGGASGGRIDRSPPPPGTYEHWLDERDARVPAPPDPRVRLVTESGKTVGSTCESNAERMALALAARHGPLRVVPASPLKQSFALLVPKRVSVADWRNCDTGREGLAQVERERERTGRLLARPSRRRPLS